MPIKPEPDKNFSTSNFWKKYFKKLPKNWKNINPNCVDGRGWTPEKGKTPELAPQTLGGSLNFAVLKCLFDGQPLNFENIKKTLQQLSEQGFALGLHIDDHNKDNPEKSGCGFADNLPTILSNLINLKEKILSFLTQQQILQPLGLIQEEVENQINFLVNQIQTVLNQEIAHGDALISGLQNDSNIGYKIVVYELQGEHEEKAALVNLQEGKTFDTIRAAQEGNQAFNLDLPYILEVTQSLGIYETFTKVASLALYFATERTLRAGENPLPVVII